MGVFMLRNGACPLSDVIRTVGGAQIDEATTLECFVLVIA